MYLYLHLWFTRTIVPLTVGVVLLLAAPGHGQEQRPPVAQETISPSAITWHPHVPYEALTLRVGSPTGQVFERKFGLGHPVVFDSLDERGQPLPDGVYRYELVVTPLLDPAVKAALRQVKMEDAAALEADLQAKGLMPRQPLIQGGYFLITNGALTAPAGR
jgi:hypothetical protein